MSVLNLFLTEMVEVVEQHHSGMVNKFLGDGFMALFGEWTGQADHADAAGIATLCNPAPVEERSFVDPVGLKESDPRRDA